MGPSKSQTKADRAWIAACLEFGCLACDIDGHPGTPGEYHHIVHANKRLGHLFGFSLCVGHHRGDGGPLISIHPWRKQFEARYGTQLELLGMMKERLGIFDKATYSA